MLNKLLTLKHWQIFLLTFGIPFIAQILATILLFFLLSDASSPSSAEMNRTILTFFPFLIFINVIGQLIYLMWCWEIGTRLHAKIPESIRPNLKHFKIAALLILIFLIITLVFIFHVFSVIRTGGADPAVLAYFIYFFPLQIVMLIVFVYTLYYLGKTISLAEHKSTDDGDYLLNTILLWLYPIGVWILQPKINRIMQESDV